jgi:hypothetical protein
MTGDAGSAVIASYALSRRGLLLYLAIAGPVGGLVVGLIELHIAQAPQGAVLFILFMGIGAVDTYVFGFHQICLVELTPVELRWRQALHGGVAPLSDAHISCGHRGIRQPQKAEISGDQAWPDRILGQAPRNRAAGDRRTVRAQLECGLSPRVRTNLSQLA